MPGVGALQAIQMWDLLYYQPHQDLLLPYAFDVPLRVQESVGFSMCPVLCAST